MGLAGGYFLGHSNNVPDMEQVLVAAVLDGDTIELVDGRHIRYLGIDTPESGEPYADEATTRNRQLVGGKVVELQRGKRNQDEYGRFLRYVYIDGTFVNAELVAQGFAHTLIFDPDERYAQILVQLEQYAKMRKIGMWAEQ
jgi:micrococcal nuclease